MYLSQNTLFFGNHLHLWSSVCFILFLYLKCILILLNDLDQQLAFDPFDKSLI
jgi:hypothetical protein